MADNIMGRNAVDPDNHDENGMDIEENEGNYNEQEFQSLNAQLDQLNSVLDTIEMKANDVRAELVELLKSNKETRKQFQECVKADETTKPSSDSQ